MSPGGEQTDQLASRLDQLASTCMRHCDLISQMTECEGEITRRFLTPPIQQSHDYLRGCMETLGLSVRVDDAGNLIGRREGTNNKKTLLVGSHLDTVPGGGKYDGLLGVTLGIAALELIGPVSLPMNVDVIGFSEEEGVRFAQPYLGSSAIAGVFESDWLDRLDGDGQSMRSVMEAFGLQPSCISDAAYRTDEVIGFVEAHIEQGPLLYRVDRPVGLVDSIAGQSRLQLRFTGRQGHAGTVPMSLRHDALVSAARWIAEVSRVGNSIDGLRATIGRIKASPNARNVIPDTVELSLDVRHFDDKIREDAVTELCRIGMGGEEKDGVRFEVIENQAQCAVQMDDDLCSLMNASMASKGIRSFRMFSGAGHDAAVMASKFPTSMLFLRQVTGISHHPDEDVAEEDVAVAIDVLADFILRVAQQVNDQDKMKDSR
ncbi:MAG: Zn-dependent hydrolase [Planctomycetota bacterium]